MDIATIRSRILNLSSRRRKDPVMEVLEAAPLDDEPVTEDDLRSLEEGWQDYLAGRTISSEEVKRKFREQAAGR